MFVEILDPQGKPLAAGERGEVTLTGGFNFCLPLLRYRTGDYAALRFTAAEPVLVGLEGRPPVLFRTTRGEWINNIEVTHALQAFAIPQYTMHQNHDRSLRLRLTGPKHQVAEIQQVLLDLFGSGQQLDVQVVEEFDGKVVQYTSDLVEDSI
jgi:phenylacetate-CoA ligase